MSSTMIQTTLGRTGAFAPAVVATPATTNSPKSHVNTRISSSSLRRDPRRPHVGARAPRERVAQVRPRLFHQRLEPPDDVGVLRGNVRRLADVLAQMVQREGLLLHAVS